MYDYSERNIMNKQAILEAVKEVGRLAFFAALTAVVGWVATQLSTLDTSSAYYIVGTVALRFVDKYIHTNEDMDTSGIAPF